MTQCGWRELGTWPMSGLSGSEIHILNIRYFSHILNLNSGSEISYSYLF